MKAVVEPLEGNKVKLSVEVDEQEFDKAVDAAFRRIAREVRIPGFRPGKAPRRLLEARLGPGVARQEALRESLPEFYAQALREADVDAIAAPEIDITSGEERGPVSFDAVVEVRPQVTVAGYGGLRVTIPSPLATEADVDAHIDRLRQQSAELRSVSRPALRGDHAFIDIAGEREGEPVPGLTADDYLYEVGSGIVVPELDDQLTGAKVGDILRFTAKVDEGPSVSFRVLVKDVKERVLPAVTDEWVAAESEFETVEELRADVRQRLGAARRVQATLAVREETIKALVELVDVEAPEPLVRPEMERRLLELTRRLESKGATLAQYLQASQTTEEEFVAGLQAEAADGVKADLALRAVADAEDLEATDEEVGAEIARLAERMQRSATDVRRELERQEAMPTVRSDVRKAKALEWLVEHVEVVDEEGHPVDRALLSLGPEAAPERAGEAVSPE
ncbi:MAG: trigger factor [Actinomycetota bacterium]|jgi:trigger factor|nr:trigger factor [Actinomycetota bacterium]HSH23624.1 trigger factor [Acidimicrobiales bacterium]